MNKDELINMIARIIYTTPEEFIDFEEVEVDLSHEFSVDGDDESVWYPGCKVRLHSNGRIVIVIPLKRKASVYAYYADQMDAHIKDAEETVLDLKHRREVYRALGESKEV